MVTHSGVTECLICSSEGGGKHGGDTSRRGRCDDEGRRNMSHGLGEIWTLR
jgi:hypothetical protein